MKLSITITGMHCESCVESIRRRISQVLGVEHCNVEVGRAVVTLDDRAETKAAVLGAVRAAGAFTIAGFSSS